MLQAIFPRSGTQGPFEPPITKKDSCQAEQCLDVGMMGHVFGCFGCQNLLRLDVDTSAVCPILPFFVQGVR